MLLIAICLALLTAASALECEVCFAINTNMCSGHYETCTNGQNRCMTKLTQTSLGNGKGVMKSAVLQKSCASAYNCTHPATLNTAEFQVRVTTMCCDKDFCNNATINWKPPNSTLNGVTCESCFAKNSDKCEKRTPMNCSGDETHCVYYSASRDGGSTISVAGCASKTMQLSEGRAAFQGSTVIVHPQKSNGSQSRRHNPTLLLLMTFMAKLWMFSH